MNLMISIEGSKFGSINSRVKSSFYIFINLENSQIGYICSNVLQYLLSILE